MTVIHNHRRRLPLIARLLRYGSCIPMAPMTFAQYQHAMNALAVEIARLQPLAAE